MNPRRKSDQPSSKTDPASKQKPQEGMRETIEAVAIAFILAFVFKTFEAEAFVIPTGSMAPTLFGRHKEVNCPGCGLHYTVGASTEIDQQSGVLLPERRLRSSTCPNCRRSNDVYAASVFNGDRIVVNKQVSEYERFNVVVFKNPEEPNVNFIKRLIGLPGETIRLRQGDVFARPRGDSDFQIQRKADPEVQRDIQLLVYDDDHPPRLLLEQGNEERWVPSLLSPGSPEFGFWPQTTNAWQPDRAARVYSIDAPVGDVHWLRYRHLIPGDEHWSGAEGGAGRPPRPIEPQLIADFCGFNETSTTRNGNPGNEDRELYWTSDLTLSFDLEVESVQPGATLMLELEEGLRTVRLIITPENGKAELALVDWTKDGGFKERRDVATATTDVQQPGSYTIEFANVDDRVCVWINDALVDFGTAAELASFDLNRPSHRDLAPAGIAVSGMKAQVRALKLLRDIYYRNDVLDFDQATSDQGYPSRVYFQTIDEVPKNDMASLNANLRNPANYASQYAALTAKQEAAAGTLRDYVLDSDEFLMCGDNSPASQDSRLFTMWSRPARGIEGHRYAVRRDDLIGEALVIFWPHGIPFLNGGRGYSVMSHKRFEHDGNGNMRKVTESDYPLYVAPFYPNLSRMKVIR